MRNVGGARPGAGRPPAEDKMIPVPAKVPESIASKIPGNRSEWVREAIRQRAVKDGILQEEGRE